MLLAAEPYTTYHAAGFATTECGLFYLDTAKLVLRGRKTYKINTSHNVSGCFSWKAVMLSAGQTQNKSGPQSQLSKSAYSSLGHTQANMCLWHSGLRKSQQRNAEWQSLVIMDLCGETNYKLWL